TSTKSAVPIDVLTSKAIEASGLLETWQILQRLIPTANSAHIPRGDDGTRPITLRGLSPGQVLILVNGKRLHNPAVILGGAVLNGNAANDAGSIPSIAIERIEILRDGAAAQYGSDAIAGVINIVLKAGTGVEARSSLGRVSSSEGGRSFRDGGVVNAAASYGARINETGFAILSAEWNHREGTNRAYPDQRQQYFAGDPRNSNPPVVRNQEGDGESQSAGLLLNAAVPLRGQSEAYFVGSVAHRQATAASLFRRSLDSANTVRAIHPDGFLPRVDRGISDFSASAGMRGTVRLWRWDVSSTLGRNSFSTDVHDSNNPSMGLESPTDFYVGKQHAYQWTSNLDLVHRWKVRDRLPINIAAGGEFRIDTYGIGRGDPASYENGGRPILDGPAAGQPAAIGSQGLIGFQPRDEISARRSNVAGYIDLESRVFPRLLVDGAGRAERYSDFGGTVDGKLAVRFELLRGVALRGSVGTGFRAPSLNQSYFASTRSAFIIKNGVAGVSQIRTLPVHTDEAKLLGALPLGPEQSVNRSVGLVFDMASLPTVTIDYYNIRINGRIVPTSEFTDTSVTRLLTEHGLPGIAGAQYFANAADTRTNGFDIVLRHGVLLGREGLLQLVGGYNQTRTRATAVRPTPPELKRFQATLFGRSQRGSIERAQPDRTLALTTDLSFRRMSVDIHNQRFGRTAILDAVDPAKDQTVEPTWITDTGLSYKITRRLTASASVANLFDKYPSEWIDFKNGVNAKGLSVAGNFRYAVAISPFGANGRTIYVHLTYR
ncbi:MAG: TonB-dependent receptor, partial [Gemmatimonadaceae bacterium]